MIRFLIFLFALSARVLQAQALPLEPSGEDLFKWGEYDSLIRVLEPQNESASIHPSLMSGDSASRAKSFLFLGVAFYATRKVFKADEAFTKACELDPDLKLDRFYVTDEIAEHFQTIAKDTMRRRQRRQAAANSVSGPVAPHRGENRKPVLANSEGNPWIWWGLGVAAVAIAGGGAFYMENQSHVPDEKITTIDLTK